MKINESTKKRLQELAGLNESFANQERNFKRQAIRLIIQWIKKVLSENDASELLNARQSDPVRYLNLGTNGFNSRTKWYTPIRPKKMNHTTNALMTYHVLNPNQRNWNISGRAFGSPENKIYIDISFGLINDRNKNLTRFNSQLVEFGSRLHEVFTHELQHMRQYSRNDRNDMDMEYHQRPSEIEAYAKGISRSWKYDFHHSQEKEWKRLTFPHYLYLYFLHTAGQNVSANKQMALSFFDNILQYIQKHHPTIDLSTADRWRTNLIDYYNQEQ